MGWPGIIGLGEMMNYPGVIQADPKMLGEMAATQVAGKTIGGHYASPDVTDFPAYAAGGPADDHEGTREEDAILRVRNGMRAMLRLGSAWYDVKAQITAVTEKGLDPRNFILCTDDCHSGTLVHEGHMNRVVRHAIDCGLDPLVALQMATINTATHFGLERELGSIAPGRRADCILTSDLATLPIETVIARGEIVAEDGVCRAPLPDFVCPEDARRSNLALVLQAIYNDSQLSRADLARATGLTKVTVSDLVAELIAGKAQDHQSRRAKLAVKGLQPSVLGGEAAAAGHVDHQQDLPLQGVTGELAAIESLQGNWGQGHGKVLWRT